MAGTYRFIAAYSGDANNSAVTSGCNDANESVLVTPAAPAIITHASATVSAGGAIADTATLSGGVNPTGTITFTLFGPNDATCAHAAVFTSVKAVSGDGDYTSASFVANAVGTYRWVAVYSGDANNAGVTSACNAANESVVVTKAPPAIVTVASASTPVGGIHNRHRHARRAPSTRPGRSPSTCSAPMTPRAPTRRRSPPPRRSAPTATTPPIPSP